MIEGINIGFEEIEIMLVKISWKGLLEGFHRDRVAVEHFLIEVVGEKEGDFIALKILLGTIQLFIILKKVDIEFEAALDVGVVDDGQDLI